MKTLLTAIVLILISAPVQAATTKDLLACTSKGAVDQFFTLMAQGDKRGMLHMLDTSCIMTKPGLEISILERSWTQSKIRAYTSYGAVDLWTVNENISE